jgi:hypothetical protein
VPTPDQIKKLFKYLAYGDFVTGKANDFEGGYQLSMIVLWLASQPDFDERLAKTEAGYLDLRSRVENDLECEAYSERMVNSTCMELTLGALDEKKKRPAVKVNYSMPDAEIHNRLGRLTRLRETMSQNEGDLPEGMMASLDAEIAAVEKLKGQG